MARPSRRFAEAERQAGRDRTASRATVAVLKASSRLAQTIERALADADLTLPQFNVLILLAESPTGALPLHAVVGRLIGTPSNLSWLTSRMQERGLITKDRDDDDGRVVLLTITEEGWSVLERAMPRVFAVEKQLWNAHPRTDLRELTAQLDAMIGTDHRGAG